MTEESDVLQQPNEPIVLSIAPPELIEMGVIGNNGTLVPKPHQIMEWTLPPGSKREYVGENVLATIWRITLPDGGILTEVHSTRLHLSTLHYLPEKL